MMSITISSTNIVNLLHLLVTSLREGDAYLTFQNRIILQTWQFRLQSRFGNRFPRQRSSMPGKKETNFITVFHRYEFKHENKII